MVSTKIGKSGLVMEKQLEDTKEVIRGDITIVVDESNSKLATRSKKSFKIPNG
jgi:hypothetical protein